MKKFICDFCGADIENVHTDTLPIAATFFGEEPFDIVGIDFELCKECRRSVYKQVATLIPDEKLKGFCKKAIDIKMGRLKSDAE